MSTATEAPSADSAQPVRQPLGSWGFVALMLTCSALSYIDRQVISLLVEPLKESLRISDTQVGLLQGFAFSLCYAVAGLPLAFLIDRGNRVRIAAGCVAIWSLATGACGLATGYVSFLLARAATAISEAGFAPSAVSMLTDIFPRNKLARASAIMFLGPPLGGGAALLVGGFLLSTYNASGGVDLPLVGRLEPWQAVFATLTLPGLVLAAFLLAVTRHPVRREVSKATGVRSRWGVVEIWRARFLLPYMLGTHFIMTVTFSLNAWAPSFFIRHHGVDPGAAGKMLGPLFIGGSIAGSLISFTLAAGGREDRATQRVITVATCGALFVGPLAILMTRAGDLNTALVCFALTAMAANVLASLATTPIQLTVPAAVRAQAITFGGFLLAIIAGGGGPFFVGLANDRLFGEAGIGDSITLIAGVAWALGLTLLTVSWIIARRRA